MGGYRPIPVMSRGIPSCESDPAHRCEGVARSLVGAVEARLARELAEKTKRHNQASTLRDSHNARRETLRL